MSNLLNKNHEACSEFRDHLETAGGSALRVQTLEEFFSTLPAPLQSHAVSCHECRIAAEELLFVRELLGALPAQTAVPNDWFATRVMAAISARESEVRRTGASWSAVPMLASRLALASAALLLVMSTWIYERPATAPARNSAVDSTQETLFETSPAPLNQDDILVSLAERPR
jgi:hypothetical protein